MTQQLSPSNEDRPARFRPGDHIQVRRPGSYMHHGVYVSENRVIQFGGGDIWNKRSATICVATLAEFEASGRAEVVRHGGRVGFLFVPPLPNALPAPDVIERAEWLLKTYEPGRYHLIGNNCEHMANWCACGGYSESHQVRSFFAVSAVISAGALLYTARQQRQGAAVPRRFVVTMLVLGLVNVAVKTLYDKHISRFWRDIGSQWQEYQRGQAEG